MSNIEAKERGDYTITIVVPCFNEQENIKELYNRLICTLENKVPILEIVLVDDGSTDRTWSMIKEIADSDARVRSVRLSRNFGQQAAFCAGLAVSSGDAVVTMDADLQDPPELIPELVGRWINGAEVVYTTRRKRDHDTLSKRFFAKSFYTVIGKLTGLAIPAQGGEFRLLDKKVVQVLNVMHDRQPFLRGMVAWTGFRKDYVTYDRPPRFAGSAKFSFSKSLSLAIDAIVSFSRIPMRLALPIGALLFVVGLIWSATLAILFVLGDQLALTTWLPALLFLCSGIQLLFLGVIGEYIARNLEHAAGRPLFVIAERTSDAPKEKVNPIHRQLV